MWWKNISKDSDVVVSTRVRLTRNLSEYNFPNALSKEQALKLCDDIKKVVSSGYNFFMMKDIDDNTRHSLVEQHIISKEFVNNVTTGALVMNNDYTVVTMVNEEDHLRIQAFESGFNIDKCYLDVSNFTNYLESKLDFAIHEKYGYLTACPTNVGSGMRVSVMLHLPGLARLGVLNKIFEEASNMGVSVRGLYGENSTGYGNMFQISNQKTLGDTDEQIIYKIKNVIYSIIEQERKARKIVLENSIKIEDEIFRTYGVLKNARLISSNEALKLLSKLRFGIASGIINNIKLEKVQSLIVEVQPSTFKSIIKEELGQIEEDKKRAEYIRKELD